jgi:hypothetical protein
MKSFISGFLQSVGYKLSEFYSEFLRLMAYLRDFSISGGPPSGLRFSACQKSDVGHKREKLRIKFRTILRSIILPSNYLA